jgi:hypothetical protein
MAAKRAVQSRGRGGAYLTVSAERARFRAVIEVCG